MTKKMKRIMSAIGGVSLMITAGVIGYVIGDCYGLDFDLFKELLMIYLPPIVGSVCVTAAVVAKEKPEETEVMISEETEEA